MNRRIYISGGILLFVAGVLSCSEMNEPMMRFIDEEAVKVYAPKINPDSVQVFAGRDRVKVSVSGLSSRVRNVRVSWNNDAESLLVPVEGLGEGQQFSFLLPGLTEGSHTIAMTTYDNFENQSMRTSASGNVYGDVYASTLRPRVIKDVIFNEAGNVEVIWSGANTGTVGTVLKYQDVDGVQQQLFETVRDTTEILRFKRNEDLTYQTVFLPEPMAIDTFYSPDAVRYIEGPRVDLSKAGWTASASSFDGRRTDRTPAQAIDSNGATEWVNSIVPQSYFPHTITIDMGTPQPLRGFSILQRQKSSASLLKDFEALVSADSVTWESMGNFTVASVKSLQYIDIPKVGDVQYFRLVCKSANDGKDNLAIAEIGAFVR